MKKLAFVPVFTTPCLVESAHRYVPKLAIITVSATARKKELTWLAVGLYHCLSSVRAVAAGLVLFAPIYVCYWKSAFPFAFR